MIKLKRRISFKIGLVGLLVLMVSLWAVTALAQERPEITTICQEHITFGKDASEEAIVTWRSSEENAEGYVKYWPADTERSENELQSDSETHGYRYARDNVYLYDARLTDLKADTLYNYQIYCAGEKSPQYSFYTAPEPGSDKGFTFVVMGDSRGGYDIFGQLMRYAYEAGARFVLFTGDMTDGASQPEWDYWFAGAEDTMPNLPLMPLHGNHEVMSQTYFDQFFLPDNEESYSFNYGMIHWSIVLDNSQELIASYKDWLEEDLTDSNVKWKFIGTHKPFYSTVKGQDDQESPRHQLLDIVQENGVAMTVAGHKHNYERFYPMLDGKKAEDGIIHLVTGGAGAPLYPFGPEQEITAKKELAYHLVIYTITSDMMKATVKGVNGNIIDEFVVYPRG